jgi:hypothetical protein
VFLAETKQHKNRVSNLRFRLGYNHSFVVDGVAKGVVFCLFWDDSIKIDIMSYGLHHIDCLVWSNDLHHRWRTTIVYGEPRAQDRHHMWQLIRRLNNNCHNQWLLIGDFNEVLWVFEHFSARRRPERQMIDFCEVLSQCNLHDLGFTGLPWMYDNMQKGDQNVRVRLDRAVASTGWMQRFPNARLHHIVSARSDHCPILLEVEKDSTPKPPCSFWYEIMRGWEEPLKEEIKNSWVSAGRVQTLSDVSCALGMVRSSLKRWSANKFGSVTKELKRLRDNKESQ